MRGNGLEVSVLGPIEARAGGRVVPLGGRLQRGVLAALVAHHPEPVGAERLIDELWAGEPPPSASGTLQAYVSRLRKSLGAAVIVRDGEGYRLGLNPANVDAARFERLVGAAAMAADRRHFAETIRLSRMALEEWRGEPYGELGYELFLRAERTRLEELRATAIEQYADALLEVGDTAPGIVDQLEAALAAHPFREPLWLRLMRVLYRHGRQADALRTYRRAARILGEELGLEPGPELRTLEEQILLQDPGLAAAVDAEDRRSRTTVATNLRAFTSSFVGRNDSMAQIAAALEQSRVVTLVGPGGVGKTRLAVETAWTLAEQFPAGVWEIDLVSAPSVLDAFRSLAVELGLPEQVSADPIRRVERRLEHASGLLVFDNCEHLLDEVRAVVERVIAEARSVSVVATSRQPLGLEGEVVVDVTPLAADGPTADAAGTLSPAIRLFEDRARLARPGFRVAAAGAAVDRVVAALDGLPLAIEIAAAQLALLTTEELVERIAGGDALRLLRASTDPRHETLTSLIDWSVGLLDPADRGCLLDLAVFAGSIPVDAVAFLWGVDHGVAAQTLDRLASKSLLVSDAPGEAHRYRMLETVRSYARSQVEARGGRELLETRYLDWVLATVEGAAAHFHDSFQGEVFRTLRSERTEIAHAVRLASGRSDLLRRLVGAVWYWWYVDGDLAELLASMDRTLEGSESPSLLAARALVAADRSGEPADRTVEVIDRALDLGPTVVGREAAELYLFAGDALTALGRYEESEAPLLEAESRFGGLGIEWGVGWARLRRVRIEGLGRGNDGAARAVLASAVEALEHAGDTSLLAYARLIRASMARLHGRWGDALEHGAQTVAAFRELGLTTREAEALVYVALAYINLGRGEEARAAIARMRDISLRTGEVQGVAGAALLDGQLERRLGNLHSAHEVFASLMREAELDADPWMIGRLGIELAETHLVAGETESARRWVDEVAPFWQTVEQPWFRAQFGVVQGLVSLAEGSLDEAGDLLDRAKEENVALGQHHVTARADEALAELARRHGRPGEVVRHLAVATTIRDQIGAPLDHRERESHRSLAAWSRSRLGPDEFRALWNEAAATVDVG